MHAATRRLLARLLVSTLALAALAAPAARGWAQPADEGSPAPADDRIEKAKEFYERGSRYYAQGRYKDAVRELKAAYDLSGETILLYNIAKCYAKLAEFDRAIETYEDYLHLSPDLSASDRAEVERSIQELRQRKRELMPELVIRSTPRGAEIYIDDQTKLMGQTPDKFRIEPGPHKLYLRKKGYEPQEKPFVMPTGKPLVLEFDLKPVQDYGNIQIVANVTGARVFVDGKNVGITPYREMPSVRIGAHQVILEKAGFYRWEQRVEVEKGRTALVTAELKAIEELSSAPAVLGWTSLVFGALAMGGGATAYYFADQKFNDTDEFHTLHNLEIAGYVTGGVLLTLAVTLITYDIIREEPAADMDPTWRKRYGLAPPASSPPRLIPFVSVSPGARPGQGSALLGTTFSF